MIELFVFTFKFNKKTAVFAVVVVALLLIGIVLMAGAYSKARALSEVQQTVVTVKNDRTRSAYLRQYGWEVETPAQSKTEVLIPREFSQVLENYNELQKEQGFDLKQYSGMKVKLYTYKVIGYSDGDDVVAQLYVSGNKVIGGDVHSTRLDGFMVGIRPPDSPQQEGV